MANSDNLTDIILDNDINDSSVFEIKLDVDWLARKVRELGFMGGIEFDRKLGKFTYSDEDGISILGGRLQTAWDTVQGWDSGLNLATED